MILYEKSVLIFAMLLTTVTSPAQVVPEYTLLELMRCENGRAVTSVSDWENYRRPELLQIFSEQLFGETPSQKIKATYKTVAETKNDLGGKARSKQVLVTFTNGGVSREMLLLIYYPSHVQGRVPLFVAYNYGNEGISDAENIIPSPSSVERMRASGSGLRRGSMARRWPLEMIVSQGFAVATMSNADLHVDRPGPEGDDRSVMALFDDYAVTKNRPDSWQTLGAWAWGLSRAMDYFETDERIDASKVAVMGHSRLGKAALWAGAQDSRFAIVISNESGCGGAAMSKREQGERVEVINANFPHWFCGNFKNYSGREKDLPFDQHQLIALMAPRPVYVASAEEDLWSDPEGEFLSAYHAGPVYELYGLKGLGTNVLPGVHKPIMNDVGYHIRAGVHDVADYDWQSFISFARKHFSMK